MLSKRRREYAATEHIGAATGFISPTIDLILERALLP